MVLLIPLAPLIRTAIAAILLMPDVPTALTLSTARFALTDRTEPTVVVMLTALAMSTVTLPAAKTVPFGEIGIIPAKEADHVFDD